jgi:hypothetical protein
VRLQPRRGELTSPSAEALGKGEEMILVVEDDRVLTQTLKLKRRFETGVNDEGFRLGRSWNERSSWTNLSLGCAEDSARSIARRTQHIGVGGGDVKANTDVMVAR